MALQTRRYKLPDSYFALIHEFPLTHIRNSKQLQAATEMVDRMLQEDLDGGAQEYLDALTDLIEAYERAHEPIPDVSEADVLRELMRSSDLSQSRLATQVGIAQSTISAVLTGSRALTKEQIIRLSRFFNVAPSTFMPD